MSEEEKKAIEYWTNYMDNLHWNIQLASEHHIKVLLDLIEKQDKELEKKECYMIQQDDEYSNWYQCSNCKSNFYWGEEPDAMKREDCKAEYCPFCGAKIKEVIFMEDDESEEE